MKIIIVVIDLSGGAGRVVKEVKKGLEQRGHNVLILERGNSFRDIWKIKKEIEEKNYDIIYTQDWSCSLPFIFWKNCIGCFHGNQFGITRIIQNIVGKIMGKRLVVVGPSLKKRFPKSTMIYNGVNTKEFYDMKKPRRFFGWIDKETEMFSEEDMKVRASDRNLELSVAKNIPQEKMNEWYNSLKVFASYPPETAGCNMCWIESRASGVPTILGNLNGIGIDRALTENFTWNDHINKLLEVFER